MYYYENIMVIKTIPDYEEVKRKYFDDSGNQLLVLNDNSLFSNDSFEIRLYLSITPVNGIDPTGHFAISLTMLGLIIGATVGAAVGGTVAYNVASNNGKSGWELAGWTALGVLGGGIVGGAIGAGAGALTTHFTGVMGLSITKYSVVVVKDITVLGSYPAYLNAAAMIGGGAYSIPMTVYNSMNSAEQWTNNQTYLQDAYDLGSQFVIWTEKVVNDSSALYKEIQYLIEHGIPWETL